MSPGWLGPLCVTAVLLCGWCGAHITREAACPARRASARPALTSGSALTLHSRHARLMTVAAACSRWTCFRVSQERTAEGFVQKQETRVTCWLELLVNQATSTPELL